MCFVAGTDCSCHSNILAWVAATRVPSKLVGRLTNYSASTDKSPSHPHSSADTSGVDGTMKSARKSDKDDWPTRRHEVRVLFGFEVWVL